MTAGSAECRVWSLAGTCCPHCRGRGRGSAPGGEGWPPPRLLHRCLLECASAARDCRAAQGAAQRSSPGVWAFSRSPRCLEGQGRSGGSPGWPGWTWPQRQSAGAGSPKDGPLAKAQDGGRPGRPQRPRVGATGHLGSEGCVEIHAARVLVTEGLTGGPQRRVCAQPGSPGMRVRTPVGLCPAPGRFACRRRLERQMLPKGKRCSARTRGLTALAPRKAASGTRAPPRSQWGPFQQMSHSGSTGYFKAEAHRTLISGLTRDEGTETL